MDELESKICFKRSVRTLFKFYKFFGLVNFTYNRGTNRVESSTHRQCQSTFVLGYCGIISVLLNFMGVAFLTIGYYETRASALIKSEEFLVTNRLIFKTINALFFAINYYKHRGTFADTINRMIVLSQRVQKLTHDGSLYYPGHYQKFINFRLVLVILSWTVQSYWGSLVPNVLCCLWFVHSFTLMELTLWTQLYANLALMCFYQKMNNLLSVLSAARSQRRINRCIRRMISISYEIHRVKQTFNNAFNTLHVVCFFGLFSDINCLYELLKLFVIVGLEKVHMPLWSILCVLFRIFLGRFSASQNLYLNSHLADALVQTERIFRRKLLTMFYATNMVEDREIDLVLLRHNIEDITTRSFRLFVVNRQFLFVFITNVVIAYAIVMFQNFAGDYISASGQRLAILQKSVTHA